MTQSWNAQTTELSAGWNQACRHHETTTSLSGLGTADKVSDDVKKIVWKAKHVPSRLAYFWLATTFGRVPMLSTGRTIQIPTKAR